MGSIRRGLPIVCYCGLDHFSLQQLKPLHWKCLSGLLSEKNSCSQLLSPSGKINLTVVFVANLDSQILQNNFEWGHIPLVVGLGAGLFMPGVRLGRHLA